MLFYHLGRRRSLGVLLVFTLLLTLVLHPQTASANEITEPEMRSIRGTVYLPEGDTAPAGGMHVNISVHGSNISPDINDDYNGEVQIVIPEGNNSISYDIAVPAYMPGGYTVKYSIESSQNYILYGYYSKNETVWDRSKADYLLVNRFDAEGIDLYILKGVKIFGTAELEYGETAPVGGIPFLVMALSTISRYTILAFAEYIIPEGSNSIVYSLTVPSDIAEQYIISYGCITTPYKGTGYYSQTGTVLEHREASPVLVDGNDVHGIDMTLIMNTFTISGRISLPEGEIAPVGDIRGVIHIQGEAESANDPTDNYSKLVNWSIPQGIKYIDYSIEIPCHVTEGVRVSCLPYSVHGYVDGYYCDGGMTQDYRSASIIAVGGISTKNINFNLVRGTIISGTVSLPAGDTAPSPDFIIDLYAKSDNGTPEDFSDDKTTNQMWAINQGESSITYFLVIPPEMVGNLTISCRCFPEANYISGYYNTYGTVWNPDAATPIDISAGDVYGIDLALIKTKPVTGKITLPDGETAPAGGIRAYVEVWGDNGTEDNQKDDYASIDFIHWSIYADINEGENSGTYTAPIPYDLDGSVTVKYSVDSSTGYISGYYGSNGTVWSSTDAAPVAIDEYGASDVNITMLKGRRISGSISLPEGHVVSGGDLIGTVFIRSDNGTPEDSIDDFFDGQLFCINEGENSCAFNFLVPDNVSAGFTVACIPRASSCYGGGFYNENGLVNSREAATRIYVAGSDVSGIDMVLLDLSAVKDPALVMSNNLHNNVAAGTLVQAGKEIVITVGSEGIENLKGFDLRFSYDPALFELMEVTAHEEFGVENDNVYLDYADNDGNVRVVSAILGSGDRSGDTGLVNITLKAKTKVDGKTSAVVKAQSQIADSLENLYTFENDIFSSLIVADPDIDGDDQIGESDLEGVAECFMVKKGHEGYIAKRDMDKDDIVDLFDIVYVAKVLLNNEN